MNPLCNYFGYLFLSYCLSEKPEVSDQEASAQTIAKRSNVFELEYEWQFINFTWPSEEVYQYALTAGKYIPGNVALAGIKYYNDRIYVAMPQLRPGVPVTLGKISLSKSPKLNPLIRPYPNWDMHIKPKDCTTLQSVQSMEIDKNGIMWVLDGVRINNLTKCPPKLVLMDLNNHGKVVLSYIFPKEICSSQGGFLNDIVVDDAGEGFAYITDNSVMDPGIIVYSRKQNRAWKLRDRSMFDEEDASDFVVGNLTFKQLAPVDGIALSPAHSKTRNKLLFYSALSGLNLFTIKTKVLRNEQIVKSGNWRRAIKVVGKKQGQSDGLMMDNAGNLYYTLLPLYGVGKWNINTEFSSAKILAQDRENMVWTDSFAFDDKGNLRLLTNNINKFMDTSYPLKLEEDVQFRIFKHHTGTKSYLH